MAVLLYIHGFLSSPNSIKAKQTKAWLAVHHPEIKFICPTLSSYPELAKAALDTLVDTYKDETIYAVGSSLGGFWSTYLLEKGKVNKAVLINPAVSPHIFFASHVGQEFKSFYSDERYCLSQRDIDFFAKIAPVTLLSPESYWLMVQSEDETLDYRWAVEAYQGSKQLVEEGGSHAFEGYEKHLPEMLEFFLNG